MNFRTTLILAVILSIMGAYYYFFEVKAKQEELTKEEQEKKVLNITQDQINSFEYKNKKENIDAEFVQKGNNWFLEKPVSYKADNANVFSMLDGILTAKYDEKVENAKKLEDFGLKEPNFTLALKTKEGDKLITIGDKSPTEANLYIMKDKDPNIYLIQSSAYSNLDKKLLDLRDKSLMTVERDKLSTFQIKNGTNNFVLKKDKTDWQIEAPQKFKADSAKVDELLGKLENDKLSDFVNDQPTDLKQYGLDNPLISVRLTNSGNNSQDFLIGSETGTYNFAKNSSSPTVFKIDKAISEAFKAINLDALRNKNILTFDSAKITKVVVEAVDNKLVIERDKDKKWKIVEKGTKSTAKPEDAAAFVDKLSNLNFTRTYPIDKFTLGDRIINVTLTEEGKTEPIKISFGGPTNEDKNQVYLLKPGEKEGYAVSKDIIDKIVE
jgi:hypothetical protein